MTAVPTTWLRSQRQIQPADDGMTSTWPVPIAGIADTSAQLCRQGSMVVERPHWLEWGHGRVGVPVVY